MRQKISLKEDDQQIIFRRYEKYIIQMWINGKKIFKKSMI